MNSFDPFDPTLDWMEYAKSKGVEGFMHPSELAVLVRLAEGKDYMECGSFRGLSAWCVAHTAHHVTAIDTFCANSAGQVQQHEQTTYVEFCRNLAPFWGKVTCLPYSSEKAAGLMPEAATFDVVFIDAMHRYEDVKADILRWWPRVRPGGVLCGHDYGHGDFPGVKQAFDEVFGPAEPGRVTVTLRHIKRFSGSACSVCGTIFRVLDLHRARRIGESEYASPLPICFECSAGFEVYYKCGCRGYYEQCPYCDPNSPKYLKRLAREEFVGLMKPLGVGSE